VSITAVQIVLISFLLFVCLFDAFQGLHLPQGQSIEGFLSQDEITLGDLTVKGQVGARSTITQQDCHGSSIFF
jgi:hypothetical protein